MVVTVSLGQKKINRLKIKLKIEKLKITDKTKFLLDKSQEFQN